MRAAHNKNWFNLFKDMVHKSACLCVLWGLYNSSNMVRGFRTANAMFHFSVVGYLRGRTYF